MLRKYFHQQETPFRILTISLLIGLTLPVLIQDGMFMDAMLYTSVSHNLSQGIGTFWFPQFSLNNVGGLNAFHEQPPLVFGIQSLFFKIFGDSMYVERFYTLCTLLITCLLLIALWKEINKHSEISKKQGWLPLILWISIPVCFWSYSNNMHENSMGIFTLASVLFSYRSFHKKGNPYGLLLLSALFILLAVLSKGIPGFFPVFVPFLYFLSTRRISFSKMILSSLILLLTFAFLFGIVLLIPDAKESLSTYFFRRALHRINEVPTVDSHFYILGRLFLELLPQFIIILIIIWIGKMKRNFSASTVSNQESLFFFLVGLSASLPLMLTLVQKGFYLVPALPFFALSSAILIAPNISKSIREIDTNGKKYKISVTLSIILLLGSITFTLSKLGQSSRHPELIQDVYTIGKTLKKGEVISIPQEMWNEWSLQCYLIRYYNISLDAGKKQAYYLVGKSMRMDSIPGYSKMDLKTLEYDLYERK